MWFVIFGTFTSRIPFGADETVRRAANATVVAHDEADFFGVDVVPHLVPLNRLQLLHIAARQEAGAHVGDRMPGDLLGEQLPCVLRRRRAELHRLRR
jgi:hypothetical protein